MSAKRSSFSRIRRLPTALVGGAMALTVLVSGPTLAQTTAPAPNAQQIDPNTTVVAKVGDAPVYLIDLLQMMDDLPAQYRQVPFQQIFPALLERAVDTKLLAAAARESDIAEDEDVQRRVQAAEDRVLSQAWLNTSIASQITDELIEERYASVSAEQAGGEEMRARHILLETEADATKVIDDLKAGADFAKLAEERSTGPSAVEGGDLGWFGKGQMVPEFETATLALAPGKFTETPVQTQFGWHVILLEDKRTAEAPPLDQIRDQITANLTRELIEEKLEALREDAKIQTFNLDGTVPNATPVPAPAPE
jgi:peptidyl-prolyl cis-trans isomerase C